MSGRTSRNGRPRAPRTYWREPEAAAVLDAWRASGVTLSEFAREQGLDPKLLVRWRRRLEAAGAIPARVAFHPVQLLGLPRSDSAIRDADRIEIVLGDGCAVRVPQGFAAEDLSRVLDVVRSRLAC